VCVPCNGIWRATLQIHCPVPDITQIIFWRWDGPLRPQLVKTLLINKVETFLMNWVSEGSYNVDFKNVNLATKCPTKDISVSERESWFFGPFSRKEIWAFFVPKLFLEILFFGGKNTVLVRYFHIVKIDGGYWCT
jgi:hypothetical protein